MFATNANINRAMTCSEKQEGLRLPSFTHIAVRPAKRRAYGHSTQQRHCAFITRPSFLVAQILCVANSSPTTVNFYLQSVICTVIRQVAGTVRSLYVKLHLFSCGNDMEPFPMAMLSHNNLFIALCTTFFVIARGVLICIMLGIGHTGSTIIYPPAGHLWRKNHRSGCIDLELISGKWPASEHVDCLCIFRRLRYE